MLFRSLSAPTEVLQARVASRSGDASDADATVVRLQSAYDPGALTWTEIDASRDLETNLNAARAAIEGLLSSGRAQR